MKIKCYVTLVCCILFTLVLEPGANATGVLRLNGRVFDSSSRKPIKHATVTLVELNKESEVGEEGDFSFTELEPGTYSIKVAAFGYKSRVDQVKVTDGQPLSLEFALATQPTITEVMVVTASGQIEPVTDVTQSIGIVDSEEIRAQKTVGLNELLNSIPGVKAESQAETQEVRVSIRGRGVRTGFGVRGVRILVDGIPESDSSGETQDLTGFDIGSMQRIEVVKGPMSARYGANSSGVVNMISEQGSGTPEIELRNLFGSYGFLKNQLVFSGKNDPLLYMFNVSRTELDGYREHSRLNAFHVSSRLDFKLTPKTDVSVFTRASDSDSELPGNLSADDVSANRRQASFLFKLFDAQSDETRFLMGTTINHQWNADQDLSVTFFGRAFDFQVPVPFIFLNGDRTSFGGNVRYTFKESILGKPNSFSLGLEAQRHDQFRKDFNNVGGNKGTEIQRHEDRVLSNIGFYFIDQAKLTEDLEVKAGINYARINNRVDDHFLVDGDDSGKRVFDRTTFQVGAAYHFSPSITMYGNVITGFEPPTDSEIGRNPSGTGGLNPNIKPEESINFELGGLISLRRRAFINFAAFHMTVDNEIVPTGVGFPQELFGNAAKAVHNGVELAAGLNITRDLDFKAAYTFSDFYFDRFVNDVGDFSGNDIPGIPNNRLDLTLRYRSRIGVYAAFHSDLVGKFFADDANHVVNQDYAVSNIIVGYNGFFKKYRLSVQYRLNNLFNEKYNDYVVINDRFGGYFYPSPTRNHAGTVTIGRYF